MSDHLALLKNSLSDGEPPVDASSMSLPSNPDFGYAVTRFLLSWADAGVFGADQAVLLRQALRWLKGPITITAKPPDNSCFLEKAGIKWSYTGQLQVEPFAPSWLDESPACDAPPIESNRDESFPAEAYLKSVGYVKWRSLAQKEAAWFTLHAPAGSTRVIVLPTGSGKSLCFQLLARFSIGLTVVVVPTIALAIDQQLNARRLFAEYPDVNPVYFASGDDPEITIQTVKEKRTRLLFTSPETAVSGRLRPLLDEFAKSGWLTHLVVDEAHLIETWGAHFRVEFQLLSSAQRGWRASSGGKLRTFLFSATMTKRCRDLLLEMFSENSENSEFVCQRIRPEIRYYVHRFNNNIDRNQGVIHALWHLPRPAILYVTEKAEAVTFVAELRAEGFLRIATFHGDTRLSERRDILNRWKSNELDLIVATSAFGVGVDKPDVRAVVHACYPENLDRYYQEVGRGGRDGWSSSSLLMTIPKDRKVAGRITVKLTTPDMIQRRWKSMLFFAERRDHLHYALPVAAKRTGLLGTRTFGENIRWNKRLLLQLQRGRLLDFIDLEFRPPVSLDDDPEEWAIVKLNFNPETEKLSELIEEQRKEEAEHFRAGLDRLDGLLTGSLCSSRVIAKMYGIASDQRGCPGCPHCRREKRTPQECEYLDFPDAPFIEGKKPSLWVVNSPGYMGAENRALFVDAISRFVTLKNLRQFYCGLDHFEVVRECFGEAFPSNTLHLHRIDTLPSESRLSPVATLPVVFFHFGKVDIEAVELGRRFACVHLFSGTFESDGRDVAVNEHFDRWLYDAWISEHPEHSLPCLPITQ